MSKEQPHDLIDETIHQRTRLAIMATLAGVESLDFNESQGRAGPDGWQPLHSPGEPGAGEGAVKIEKTFEGKKPRTTVAQTPKGRKALENYINLLQGILNKAK